MPPSSKGSWTDMRPRTLDAPDINIDNDIDIDVTIERIVD